MINQNHYLNLRNLNFHYYFPSLLQFIKYFRYIHHVFSIHMIKRTTSFQDQSVSLSREENFCFASKKLKSLTLLFFIFSWTIIHHSEISHYFLRYFSLLFHFEYSVDLNILINHHLYL